MRVLLDVSAVPDQLAGAGVYSKELARSLARRDDLELVLIARRNDSARWRSQVPAAEIHAVVPSARPARLAWEQVSGPRLAAKLGGDVWHGPHYTMPLRLRMPAVVTVHDLTFFDHPEWHERSKVVFFRRAITESAKRAAVIVCVSEATATRLHEVAAPKGAVVVVHHGVDTDRFRPDGDEGDDRTRLATLGIVAPYLAFVGTIEPRKNVPALVAAFARVAGDHPDLQLVLAGQPGWGSPAVDAAVAESGVADRIVRTGYVPDDAYPPLLRRASAVIYPSHEEGFGIPPLEAMACGTPVLTTEEVAAAELAGDAVATARADPASLAEGIRRVLDHAEATRLRAAGLALVGRFSWTAAAASHVAAYRTAVARESAGES
ncbi:MAG: glycosyltransferase family 1 protein [Acidimicrobiia bacterium]